MNLKEYIRHQVKAYLKEHFSNKGKNSALKESLDHDTLYQLIDMGRESAEIEGEVSVTPEVEKLAEDFENDVMIVLERWLWKNKNRLNNQSDQDVEDVFENMIDEGEAAYIILMTLRGEGVGIWDGRWDHYFKNPKEDIPKLEAFLKAKLGKWADDTGAGELNDAFMNAAYETTGEGLEEGHIVEASQAKKTEHSGAKKGKGAYWGKKKDAKKESNKVRRKQGKKEIDKSLDEKKSDCTKKESVNFPDIDPLNTSVVLESALKE